MDKVILMALLIVVSSSAMAEWVRVGGSGGDMATYVNPSTIHKDGNLIKMWYMKDFKTVQEEAANRFMSITLQGEYDCKEVRNRILTYSWYKEKMGGGNVVYVETVPSEWKPVASGSIEETVFKYACERKWRWW